jgi:hypothetical protein
VCITGEQGADSGRYRGVTTVADTGNTGVVTLQGGGEAAMNDLDRVLFMGSTVDSWVKFRVMRWDAVAGTWAAPTPESNQVEYMEALNDMTEDAPDGVFSSVFCRVLFAQQAAIDTLQSKIITLTHKSSSSPGIIQSSNYTKNNREGFQLNSNGEINAYELDTWHIRTLLFENGKIATSPMRGSLRGVYTFYYDPSKTNPLIIGLYQKNFVRLDRDASMPGVFKLRLVFESSQEAEYMQWARIFGFYNLNEKDSGFDKKGGASKFPDSGAL